MIIFHSGGLSKNAAAPEGRFLIFGRFPLTPVKIFVDFFFFFSKKSILGMRYCKKKRPRHIGKLRARKRMQFPRN